MIQFYATIGRGLQNFAKRHLENEKKFKIDEENIEGKIFFTSNQQIFDPETFLNLKFIERLFVNVSKINFSQDYTKLNLINSLKILFTDGYHLKKGLDNFTKFHNEDLANKDTLENSQEPEEKRRKTEECQQLKKISTFRISCRITGRNRKKIDDRRLSKDLGLIFCNLSGLQTNLRNPDVEISINITDSFVLVGIPVTKHPISKRLYIKNTGLRSPICDAMVQLADCQDGSIILDPMCGAGTILVEALSRNKKLVAVGCDSQDSQLAKCMENRLALKENQLNDNLDIFRFEIRERLPFVDDIFDRTLCDLPFGQIYLTEKLIETLYPTVLLEILRVTKVEGKIVLLTSQKSSELVQTLSATVIFAKQKRLRSMGVYTVSLGTTDGCISVFDVDRIE